MIGELSTLISLVVCVVVLLYIIRKQQESIDDLNNRLMSRSYAEYRSANGIKEEDASPIKDEHEPIGWYDH